MFFFSTKGTCKLNVIFVSTLNTIEGKLDSASWNNIFTHVKFLNLQKDNNLKNTAKWQRNSDPRCRKWGFQNRLSVAYPKICGWSLNFDIKRITKTQMILRQFVNRGRIKLGLSSTKSLLYIISEYQMISNIQWWTCN